MATDTLPAVTREPSRTGEQFLRALPIDPCRAWLFWDLGVPGAARLRIAFDGGGREEHRVGADLGDFFIRRDAPFRRLDAEISAEDGSVRFATSVTLPPAQHGDDPVRWGRQRVAAPGIDPAMGPDRTPQAPLAPRRDAAGSSEHGSSRFLGASETFVAAAAHGSQSRS